MDSSSFPPSPRSSTCWSADEIATAKALLDADTITEEELRTTKEKALARAQFNPTSGAFHIENLSQCVIHPN
ncbi:hypothetical protein GCM10011410_27150 [Hoyosella rhizosphaerae]|uniref:Uncharacterized protein n=1 Tax=Hoyosella rhizosphaerae TaxID=1755582 RepID=A0A916UH29_9ACTN|nr:hypothetical protein GCM10011410_27150 [Hoyosella rhizosphaerae]